MLEAATELEKAVASEVRRAACSAAKSGKRRGQKAKYSPPRGNLKLKRLNVEPTPPSNNDVIPTVTGELQNIGLAGLRPGPPSGCLVYARDFEELESHLL